jgi:hypothetical protein
MSITAPGNFTGTMVANKLKENSALARNAAKDSESRKALKELSAKQLTSLNASYASSAQQATYQSNVADSKSIYMDVPQSSISQLLDLSRELLAITNQASSASETAVTRAQMQVTVDAIVTQMDNIVRATTNQGAQLIDGTAVNYATTTAAARLAAIIGDTGNTGVMTAQNSDQANTAIQLLLGPAGSNVLTGPDILALNSIQARVEANTNTTSEFLAQAFSALSGIRLDSGIVASRVNTCIKANQLGIALAGTPAGTNIINDAITVGGGTAANGYARLAAAMLNEAVNTGDATRAAVAPVGAALIARSAAFAALLTEADKAAIRAFVAPGGAGYVDVAGAANITYAEMYPLMRTIKAFDSLILADTTLQNIGIGGAPGGLSGILGAGAAGNIVQANVFLTTRAAVTPLQRINIDLTQGFINAMTGTTPINVTVGPNTTIPVLLPNLTAANLDLRGLSVGTATPNVATGAIITVNDAIARLTSAAVSLNAQSTVMDDMASSLGDRIDDQNSNIDTITRSDPTVTASLLASIARACSMLMALLAVENRTLSEQAATAKDIARG